MTRQQANKEILLILSRYLEAYPDLRFGQALSNLGLATHVGLYDVSHNERSYHDIFFTESSQILRSLQARLVPYEETSDPDSLPGEND